MVELVTTLINSCTDFFNSIGNMLSYITFGFQSSFVFLNGAFQVIMGAIVGLPAIIKSTCLGLLGLSCIKLLLPGGN